MVKDHVTSWLSCSICSLLHIWLLNYHCEKQGKIYNDLDRVSDWAKSPVPLPHTASEPETHMGAIILKVAAVAQGDNLNKVCVHAWTQSLNVYSVIMSTHLQQVAEWKRALSR